jgi:protein-S-isoprenylcysteine O-methyltransferase Ste14
MRSASRKKIALVLTAVLTTAAVGQIALSFMLYNKEGSLVLTNVGWGVLFVSAIFGWLPIYTFRKRGGVNGRGYIHTTVLVDRGIYGIVRHPQYLAGVLICIALPLIAQHWLVAVTGFVAAVIYYIDTFDEEKKNLEKFGDEYKRYMEAVPRMNFIIGIVRLIRRKTAKY